MSDYCSDNLGRDVAVRVEFGRQKLPLTELSNMAAGGVIELDCHCDEPVAVRAGGRIIARGQAVVVDGRLGVRIEELILAPAGSGGQRA